MLELLGFIFGGVFRLVPKFLEMRERAADRQHERLMLDKQIEADKLRADAQMRAAEQAGRIALDRSEVEAIIAATQAQAAPMQLTGNKYLDAIVVFAEALSKLVRPVLTFWYCVAAYGAYKAATLYLFLANPGTTLANAVSMVWTPQDHAIMFTIVGFWFVDRALRKQSGGA